MNKIFKKSLTLALSATMCLTAFVGCLTANAEGTGKTGTVTVGEVTAEAGQEVKVDVTVKSTEGANEIAAAILGVTFDKGALTLKDVAGDATAYEKTDDGVRFTVAGDVVSVPAALTATLVFDVAADAKGTYDVKVDTTDTKFFAASTADELLVDLTVKDGSVTVKAEEVGPVEPTEVALGCQHALSLGNSIAMTYSFRNKEIVTGSGKYVADCARVYAVVTKELYSDDPSNTSVDTEIECVLSSDGKTYSFKYTGLAAKEIGKKVKARIYGEDAEGNVIIISKSVDEFSVVDYALSNVGFAGKDNNLKTCLADMLNYGAAAQLNFNYNTNDLVNERSDVKAYIEQFETKEDVVFNTVKEVIGDTGFQTTAALSLNSSIDFVANVNPARLADYDLNNIKVAFRYRNSKENKEYNIEIPYGDEENFVAEAKTCRFYLRELAAAQVSEKVYITVYSGDTAISKTTCYSVESYCYEMQGKDAKLDALCQALMKYGNSAKVALGY